MIWVYVSGNSIFLLWLVVQLAPTIDILVADDFATLYSFGLLMFGTVLSMGTTFQLMISLGSPTIQ
jgi:hypothetical protein